MFVSSIKNSLLIAFACAILFCSYLMFCITWPYFSFDYELGFLLSKQNVLHIVAWRYSFYLHISSSLLVLILGLFQFAKPLLRKAPHWHRSMGKTYVGLVLFVSAPSGLIMAFYANGGFWAKLSFCIISVLWALFTYLAFVRARQGHWSAHIDWMTRSYALTLSAITLRTYVVVLPHFFILHSKEMYVLVAWLSWVPNLILAEIVARMKVFK